LKEQIEISIIMPNYNGEQTIESSIQSFIDNNYINKELIIVDGKSTDNSHVIIEEFTKKYHFIKWIDSVDYGISDAINIGLKQTNGDIIGYLGSDDLLNSDTLFVINKYKSLIDFDGIYFDSYTYYIDKNIVKLRKCPNITFNRSNLIKFGTIVGLQNMYFDKKVFKSIKYDINNKYSMDFEIYFRILKKFSNFIYIEYPATINKFQNNISYKMSKVQTREAMDVIYSHINFADYKILPYKRIVSSIIKKIIN